MHASSERPAVRSTLASALARVRSGPPRRMLVVAALVAATALLAPAPYVASYASRDAVSPVGWDTPTYVWRTRVVAVYGADVLRFASPYAFHSNGANPDRPGLPVLGSLVSSFGVTPWHLMFVVPAVAAMASGLAGGVFALRVLREPTWAFPLYGLAVAWSPQLGVTANGYLDNLLVTGVLLAWVTVALAAARSGVGQRAAGQGADGRRPAIDADARHAELDPEAGHAAVDAAAAALLFAGALWIHWLFAVYVLVVLAVAVVAMALLERVQPRLRALRASSLWGIAGAAAASATVGAVALFLAPALPDWFSTKTRGEYLANLSKQVPYYDLAVTIPLAIAGAVALWFVGRRRPDARSRRRGLVLLAVWLVPLGVGGFVSNAGGSLPLQRLLAFSLPIAMLCAAAVTAGIRALLDRLPRPFGLAAGVVVACLGVWAAAASIGPTLARARPGPGAESLSRTRAVMRYVGETAPDRPFVVVVDGTRAGNDYRAIPALHLLRATAPAPLSLGVRIYVGDPRALLDGRPTTGRGAAFESTAALYWTRLTASDRANALALAMEPYYPHLHRVDRHGIGVSLADGVRVLRGPPPASTSTWRPSIVGGGTVALGVAVVALLLLVVGAGYGLTFTRSAGFALGLAPAFGIAALIGTGLLWSRLGLRLDGAPGIVAVLLAAAIGWTPELRRRRAEMRAGVHTSAATASTTRSTSSTEL